MSAVRQRLSQALRRGGIGKVKMQNAKCKTDKPIELPDTLGSNLSLWGKRAARCHVKNAMQNARYESCRALEPNLRLIVERIGVTRANWRHELN